MLGVADYKRVRERARERRKGERERGKMVFKGEVKFDDAPPEDFDPSDPYKDPVAFLEMREYITREKLIGVERAKILRERARRCYRREGVNHYQNCRTIVRQYLESIKNVGWGNEYRPDYPLR